MKRVIITLDSRPCVCPFAATFPDLNADEEAYLRESFGRYGVRNPILTYDSPTHGFALIQGRNRHRIGTQLGVPIPRFHFGEIDDATAEGISVDVQAAGRLLTPGAVERVRRVTAAALAGKSRRAIAAENGVSTRTVGRDLEESDDGPGVASATPGPEGERWSAFVGGKVLGRDGKTYRQAPKALRPPEPDGLESLRIAERVVKGALAAVEVVLTGPGGDRLRAVAPAYGVVIEGDVYLPLVALAAALGAAVVSPGL